MNSIVHFVISTAVALVFQLPVEAAALVGLGSVLIDNDHIIYMMIAEQRFSLREMIDWVKRETAVKKPHFYVFHTIEFIVVINIIALYTNVYFFLITLGFVIHFITDAIFYRRYYKSWFPRANYMSLFYYLSRKR